jgi:hypothetical protein
MDIEEITALSLRATEMPEQAEPVDCTEILRQAKEVL